MPYRITTTTEIYLGVLTFASTVFTTNFFLDVIIAVITYSSARLFYHYFGEKIKRIIDNLKSKFKRLGK